MVSGSRIFRPLHGRHPVTSGMGSSFLRFVSERAKASERQVKALAIFYVSPWRVVNSIIFNIKRKLLLGQIFLKRVSKLFLPALYVNTLVHLQKCNNAHPFKKVTTFLPPLLVFFWRVDVEHWSRERGAGSAFR